LTQSAQEFMIKDKEKNERIAQLEETINRLEELIKQHKTEKDCFSNDIEKVKAENLKLEESKKESEEKWKKQNLIAENLTLVIDQWKKTAEEKKRRNYKIDRRSGNI